MNDLLDTLHQNLDDVNNFSQKLQDPSISKNQKLDIQVQQLKADLEKLDYLLTTHKDELDKYKHLKKTLSDIMGNVKITFDTIKLNTSKNFTQFDLKAQVNYINSALDLADNLRHSYSFINEIIKIEIDQQIEIAQQKLQKFDQVINQLQGIATEQVYAKANTTYKTRYKNLENLGYGAIALSFFSTFVCLWIYHRYPHLLYSLITFKITFILIAIFLITYFFKQATQYRKLADSAEQRHLELQAIPSFLSTISNETQNDVRKELALKYFGQPLDDKHYSSTERLIEDQIKSSTEVLKMTTSLLKSERSILNTANNNQNSQSNDR